MKEGNAKKLLYKILMKTVNKLYRREEDENVFFGLRPNFYNSIPVFVFLLIIKRHAAYDYG